MTRAHNWSILRYKPSNLLSVPDPFCTFLNAPSFSCRGGSSPSFWPIPQTLWRRHPGPFDNMSFALSLMPLLHNFLYFARCQMLVAAFEEVAVVAKRESNLGSLDSWEDWGRIKMGRVAHSEEVAGQKGSISNWKRPELSWKSSFFKSNYDANFTIDSQKPQNYISLDWSRDMVWPK